MYIETLLIRSEITWKKGARRKKSSLGRKMVHEKSVIGAIFNTDETRILTWSGNTVKLWDIGLDLDFPDDKIKLQVWALTGTRFNTNTMEIEFLEPDEWRKIKKEYMAFAKEHYKICKYPHANVFRKLFPEEAKKIRSEEAKKLRK